MQYTHDADLGGVVVEICDRVGRVEADTPTPPVPTPRTYTSRKNRGGTLELRVLAHLYHLGFPWGGSLGWHILTRRHYSALLIVFYMYHPSQVGIG